MDFIVNEAVENYQDPYAGSDNIGKANIKVIGAGGAGNNFFSRAATMGSIFWWDSKV